MTYRQLFFIENRLVGEALREPKLIHATLQPPMSYLFFCGYCGEVFARCPVIGVGGNISPWQSIRCCCRACSSKARFQSEWPGCITLSWDHDFTNALPMPVLAWELERHLDHYERFYHATC